MYAIVEFQQEESVSKVLGKQELPPLNGRTLRVKARSVPKERKPGHGAGIHLSPSRKHNLEQELPSFLGEEVITKLRSASLVS